MDTYQKIYNIFKRDEKTKKIIDEYTFSVFEYLSQNPWQWFEKIHGTNIRVILNQETYGIKIKGRKEKSEIPKSIIERINVLLPKWKIKILIKALEDLIPSSNHSNYLTLYGEGYGKKIQDIGHFYKADGVDFIVFDIGLTKNDSSNTYFLSKRDAMTLCSVIDLHFVPYIGTYNLPTMIQLIKDGKIKSKVAERDLRIEGCVGTPLEPLYLNNERIIVKIKSIDFNLPMKIS